MKKLVAVFVLGFALGAIVTSESQVDPPTDLRVPPIAGDSTWTDAQRRDLLNQWNKIVTQQSQVNRWARERMNKID